MQISYRLRLPRDAATVSLVRALCQDAMTRVGVVADDVDDVGLAITEACANVVAHAARGSEYEVDVAFADEDCHVRVIDMGVGFAAHAMGRPMPRPTDDRGRGIALMEQLMDRIHFDSRPETGTIVHLHKQLDLTNSSPLGRLGSRGDDH